MFLLQHFFCFYYLPNCFLVNRSLRSFYVSCCSRLLTNKNFREALCDHWLYWVYKMRFAALLLSKSRWLSGKTNLLSEMGVEMAMRVQTPLEANFFSFFFFFIFSFLSTFYNVLEKYIWKKKCNHFNEILCWIYKALFSLYS